MYSSSMRISFSNTMRLWLKVGSLVKLYMKIRFISRLAHWRQLLVVMSSLWSVYILNTSPLNAKAYITAQNTGLLLVLLARMSCTRLGQFYTLSCKYCCYLLACSCLLFTCPSTLMEQTKILDFFLPYLPNLNDQDGAIQDWLQSFDVYIIYIGIYA